MVEEGIDGAARAGHAIEWPRHSSAHLLCGVPPPLYRGKHILGAVFAGPTSKTEGIADLRAAVRTLPKEAAIVIYRGCCPMTACPNIRPAYSALKALGFNNLRVLDLPTNFHTDWAIKGYPVS
jgi:hypothetical protein